MPPLVQSRLNGASIILRVELPRRREVSVVIKPQAGRVGADGEEQPASLMFEIWARFVGERLWHAWPSEHCPDDFLDRFEDAVIRWGMDELMEQCIGRALDADTMALATGAVELILVHAAGAQPPQAAA